MKQVYIISGPPGAGKSTYVQERAAGRDIVVDLDCIAQALRGGELYGDNTAVMDAILNIRETLYDVISSRRGKWENAYVITTGRNAHEIAERLRGSLIELNTPKEVCKERILADDRRRDKALYLSLVDQWFSGVEDSPTPGQSGGKTTTLRRNETVSQDTNTTPKNAEGNGGGTPPTGERIFTQAQLDAIVTDRLSRERAKFADYETLRDKAAKFDAAEEAGKTELQKATDKAAKLEKELNDLKQSQTMNAMRARVAADMKLPAGLAEFLTADDEDGCKAQAQKLLDQFKPGGYPAVQDGGSPQTPPGSGSTREQFAEWFNQI